MKNKHTKKINQILNQSKINIKQETPNKDIFSCIIKYDDVNITNTQLNKLLQILPRELSYFKQHLHEYLKFRQDVVKNKWIVEYLFDEYENLLFSYGELKWDLQDKEKLNKCLMAQLLGLGIEPNISDDDDSQYERLPEYLRESKTFVDLQDATLKLDIEPDELNIKEKELSKELDFLKFYNIMCNIGPSGDILWGNLNDKAQELEQKEKELEEIRQAMING